MRKILVLVLLACAPAPVLGQAVGCTPVTAQPINAKALEILKKGLPPGEGARVPMLANPPGEAWDLGEGRTARLSVYLTKHCQLGLSVGLGSQTSSSPDPRSSVDSLAGLLKSQAPDWSMAVEPPNTIRVSREKQSFSTDLRKLLQLRLDAGTSADLAGAPVKAVFDGWLLFLVPQDAAKALNLSKVSSVYPWAYYDLTPYGLPKLLVRFDDGAAVLWPLR